MSRLTRDGTAEPVSRDQILRHARGQGNVHFPCSADHEQDWQPYPVDPYSAICDDHRYIHTYMPYTELRRILEGSVLFKIVLRKDGMAVYCGDKVDLLLQPNALIDATFSHLHMNPCIAGVGCLCRGVFPSHSRRSQPRQKKFG